jgi:DNA-binding transcriptional regulator/RsmH inhibitor MraZ
LLFVGTYEHTIDAKQRLAIPGPMREEIDQCEPGACLYAVVQQGPMLCLYTKQGFEKRAEELDRSTRPAEEVLAYEQVFYSMTQRVEIDNRDACGSPNACSRRPA